MDLVVWNKHVWFDLIWFENVSEFRSLAEYVLALNNAH